MSLFSTYPGDAGTVTSAGADAASSARTFTTVRTGLSDGKSTARGAVGSTLAAPVESAVDGAENDAAALSRAGYLVKGVCHMFAGAIKEYDTGIGQLNETYDKAKANNFGVSATTGTTQCYATPEDVPPGENAQAIANARDALVAELTKTKKQLKRELDRIGDEAADMLDKGPMDPSTIVQLATVGGLSAAALAAWPADLTKDALTAKSFLKGLKKVMGGPAALRKLRELYRATGNAADAADKLAGAVKDWDAIYDAIANSTIDPKSAAALGAWLRGQSDIADLKKATDLANEALGDARSEMLKNLKLASKTGKALGVLGIALSAYDAYTLAKEWDDLSTTKKVTRSVEVGAGLAGSAATIALLAGATGPAAPAVLVVAGIVGGAAAIYNNWDTISEYAGKAKDWTVDRYNDARDWTGDQLEKAGGYMKEGFEDAKGWMADRGEDIANGAGEVRDWAGDRLDDAGKGLSALGGAAESVAPWNW